MKSLSPVLLFCLAISSSSLADTIQCESENVTIRGDVDLHYLRMGHSTFEGYLSMTVNQNGLAETYTTYVRSGQIQDDSVYFSNQRDSDGKLLTLEANDTLESQLTIDGRSFLFIPRCTVAASPQSPQACPVGASVDRICGIVNGACVCHYRNTH